MIHDPTLLASSFGAVGDGVHDDAPAIQAALDAAVAVTEDGLRRRSVVRLAPGRYLLGAPLTLGATPMAIVGDGFVPGCGDAEPSPRVQLLAAHPGPVLRYAADAPPEFSLFGLALVRTGGGGGDGLHVVAPRVPRPGPTGIDLEGLVVVGMGGDAIHLDLGEQSPTPVRVHGCSLRHNRGWGLWCTGALAQGTVRDSGFIDNAEGGVNAGSFGLVLEHNRFVDQPRPVVVEGRNNRGVSVTQNVFSGATLGRACIDLRRVHRFRVENNVFGAPGAPIPPVHAEHCTDGHCDVAALLVDCVDVVGSGGYLARSAFDRKPAWAAAAWSLSRTPMPALGLSPVGVPELLRNTMVGPPPSVGLHKVRFGRERLHILEDDVHVPGRFTVPFAAESDLEDEDLVWLSFLVRYAQELPPSDARIHVELWAGPEEVPLASWAITPPPLLFMGETLQVLLGLQLERPNEPHPAGLLKPRTHPHLTLRIHAFGPEHQGRGAMVTRVVMVRFPDGGLPGRPDLNPAARAYPPPMPLLDPIPALVELVEHPRLNSGLD